MEFFEALTKARDQGLSDEQFVSIWQSEVSLRQNMEEVKLMEAKIKLAEKTSNGDTSTEKPDSIIEGYFKQQKEDLGMLRSECFQYKESIMQVSQNIASSLQNMLQLQASNRSSYGMPSENPFCCPSSPNMYCASGSVANQNDNQQSSESYSAPHNSNGTSATNHNYSKDFLGKEHQSNLTGVSYSGNCFKYSQQVFFTLSDIMSTMTSQKEISSPLYSVESAPLNIQMLLRFNGKREVEVLIHIFKLNAEEFRKRQGLKIGDSVLEQELPKWPLVFNTRVNIQVSNKTNKYSNLFAISYKNPKILEESDFTGENHIFKAPLCLFGPSVAVTYYDLVANHFVMNNSINFKWAFNFTDPTSTSVEETPVTEIGTSHTTFSHADSHQTSCSIIGPDKRDVKFSTNYSCSTPLQNTEREDTAFLGRKDECDLSRETKDITEELQALKSKTKARLDLESHMQVTIQNVTELSSNGQDFISHGYDIPNSPYLFKLFISFKKDGEMFIQIIGWKTKSIDKSRLIPLAIKVSGFIINNAKGLSRLFTHEGVWTSGDKCITTLVTLTTKGEHIPFVTFDTLKSKNFIKNDEIRLKWKIEIKELTYFNQASKIKQPALHHLLETNSTVQSSSDPIESHTNFHIGSPVFFTLNDISSISTSGKEILSPMYSVESFPFNLQMALRFDEHKRITEIKEVVIQIYIFRLKDHGTNGDDQLQKWPLTFHTTGHILRKKKYSRFFIVQKTIIKESDFKDGLFAVKASLCISAPDTSKNLKDKKFIVDESLSFKLDFHLTDPSRSSMGQKPPPRAVRGYGFSDNGAGITPTRDSISSVKVDPVTPVKVDLITPVKVDTMTPSISESTKVQALLHSQGAIPRIKTSGEIMHGIEAKEYFKTTSNDPTETGKNLTPEQQDWDSFMEVTINTVSKLSSTGQEFLSPRFYIPFCPYYFLMSVSFKENGEMFVQIISSPRAGVDTDRMGPINIRASGFILNYLTICSELFQLSAECWPQQVDERMQPLVRLRTNNGSLISSISLKNLDARGFVKNDTLTLRWKLEIETGFIEEIGVDKPISNSSLSSTDLQKDVKVGEDRTVKKKPFKPLPFPKDSHVFFTVNDIYDVATSGKVKLSPVYYFPSYPCNFQLSLSFDESKEMVLKLIFFKFNVDGSEEEETMVNWPFSFVSTGHIKKSKNNKYTLLWMTNTNNPHILKENDFKKNKFAVKPPTFLNNKETTLSYDDLHDNKFVKGDSIGGSISIKWSFQFTGDIIDSRTTILEQTSTEDVTSSGASSYKPRWVIS